MKIAVIYRSKYGATKQYAEWIAEELNADLFEYGTVKPSDFKDYDLIIYGGGLYAGGISGVKLVTKKPNKSLIVFTTGITSAETINNSELINRNIPSDMQSNIKLFYLRGSLECKKLNTTHKIMISMLKKFMLDKKSQSELTADDKAMLESYSHKVDFCDKQNITPLIEYVKTIV